MNVLATEPMCSHCELAASTVRALRVENDRFRKEIDQLKRRQLRHERARSRKRVEKRTGLELADQLEFTHGLEVVDLGHGRWRACCPAHQDEDPSLQITEKADGQILIHCWTGCEPEAVLDAIGWEWGNLRAANDR